MKRNSFCIFLVLLYQAAHVSAQVKKRLYIANDDHTDYMWSGTVAQYDSAFVKMLDFHLDKIDATKAAPSDFQDRFNCDGSYWLKTYAKYRSPDKFYKLIDAIRSGHISSQLNTVVSTYGAQPAEAVIRGMYYAGQLERKYKLRFTMASAMENNTLPLGLSSLWAGSGAKYSWKGVGGYGSQLSQESMKHRTYEIYRSVGLDGSSVLTKWYAQNGSLGGYAECRLQIKGPPADTVKLMERVIDKLTAFCDPSGSRYPYDIGAAFGFGHDDLQTFVSRPFTEAARKFGNEQRSIRVSNEEDFFKDFENTYREIPSQRVSFGNEWDLLCASMNETTAEVKRATERLRTAEALASLVSLKNPGFARSLVPARNLAWDAFGLYWEHNWTADGPVGNEARGDWQVVVKDQLTSYVDSLLKLSRKALAGQIRQSGNPRFYVFNPLGWTRDDFADLEFSGDYPVRVFDLLKNQEVDSQPILKDGKRFLRIWATSIPSVGYKVFELRKGAGAHRSDAAKMNGEYLSNPYYRIRFKPSGVITEIIDKRAGNRQLVRPVDGKYLNDLGTENLNEGDPVRIENAGPVSVTFMASALKPVIHTVRITLFAKSDRIDIENSIDTNFTDNKTWAFSFDLNHQTTHHEETGAVLTVKKLAQGGNYSNQNARYDWQTFNHFADMSESGYGITISNLDCSFFKLGRSTIDSLWDQSTQLNALAGGRIDTKKEDKGVLGVTRQHGENHFHYHFALLPHQYAFNKVSAMKFALEHQNALTAEKITGAGKADERPAFSMLHVSNPGIVLWSIKPAEEGIDHGLITRFWNLNEKPVAAALGLYSPLTSAWKTSHIETDQARLKPVGGLLKVKFSSQQMQTYRLITAKK